MELAGKAGYIMRSHLKFGMARQYKADKSPVTEADLAINALVLERVSQEFPEDDILAEEDSRFSGNKERVWVCDPIDGTIPFSHGMPLSMFSLALVENGQPILGVIYDPFLNRLFLAEKGRGTVLNGKAISVSNQTDLETASIGLGSLKDAFGLLLSWLVKEEFRVFPIYCITYLGGMVAAGELVAALYRGKSPWDIAAIKIIVEEAGGRVTDLNGNPQRYDSDLNGALLSNGWVHERLLRFLQEVKKD